MTTYLQIINKCRFIDAQTWNEPLYPPCCFGCAYFIAPNVVADLIAAHEIQKEPFVPFEDVYITGKLLFHGKTRHCQLPFLERRLVPIYKIYVKT